MAVKGLSFVGFAKIKIRLKTDKGKQRLVFNKQAAVIKRITAAFFIVKKVLQYRKTESTKKFVLQSYTGVATRAGNAG